MKKLGAAIMASLTIIALLFIFISSCKKTADKQTSLKFKPQTQIKSISPPTGLGTDYNFDSISITANGF